MPLQAQLFADDPRLQACLTQDPAHVTPGSVGDHVSRIQTALILLDDLRIDAEEIAGRRYGPSTAAAVLKFKQKRTIVNRAYQTQADNIVGKMTIAALDNEMLQRERGQPAVVTVTRCRWARRGARAETA
jgi:peptidoglycan hydrolase-like protein with peptidoglycan-binding domain